MEKKEQTHTGVVVGHVVPFLPQQEREVHVNNRDDITWMKFTKAAKVGAFVQIQVDNKRYFTVPIKDAAKTLDREEPVTNDMRMEVYNTLKEAHPIGSERSFIEHITPKKSKKGKKGVVVARRYELTK